MGDGYSVSSPPTENVLNLTVVMVAQFSGYLKVIELYAK
jgi:hypothetical protein